MPNIAYNISLKDYVGGLDFDRSKVDKELAKNEDKEVICLSTASVVLSPPACLSLPLSKTTAR